MQWHLITNSSLSGNYWRSSCKDWGDVPMSKVLATQTWGALFGSSKPIEKPGTGMCICNSSTGGGQRQVRIHGTHLPGHLAKPTCSSLVRDPVAKKKIKVNERIDTNKGEKGEGDNWCQPLGSSHLCAHVHTLKHTLHITTWIYIHTP